MGAPVTIDGDPLDVTVDEFGALQARFDGRDTAEFYPPSGTVGNAGFHVSVFSDPSFTLYGPSGSGYTPQSGPVALPPAPGDPTKRVSVTYNASDDLRITQVIEYRDGDREFTANHTVTNVRGAPVRFSAAEYADLYLTGSDLGTGFLDPGPPRIVGGINPNAASGGGIVEVSPGWDAYEANNLGTVGSHLSSSTGPEFDGTLVQEVVDNAVGVQWDTHKTAALGPNGQATFSIRWRFGEFDVPPPPPEAGVSFNVDPFGDARVKYPPGFTPPGQSKRAHAAQSGFVPLTNQIQLPMGSIVDVRRGGVALTSASNLRGGTQTGTFTKGTFRVTQPRTTRPITALNLTGGNFRRCRAGAGRATAARTIRRLRGSARGRFRTRGRRSSATVRGTRWRVADTCRGTLTTVQSGRVAVRDFRKRRTITLRRGGRYLAR
jgi:hypothetical protein